MPVGFVVRASSLTLRTFLAHRCAIRQRGRPSCDCGVAVTIVEALARLWRRKYGRLQGSDAADSRARGLYGCLADPQEITPA